MEISSYTELSAPQKADIREIWNAVYPDFIAFSHSTDFDSYLNTLRHCTHYIASDYRGKVFGWLATFHRDDERWMVMMIDESAQSKGVGKGLLRTAQDHEDVLCGWVVDHDRYVKVNGKRYRSPLSFYVNEGFEVLSDVRFEDGKLSAVKVKWVG